MTSRSNVVLIINPVPASRPRVTRWGTYYGKTYKTFLDELKKKLALIDAPPKEGPLEMRIWFYVKKPKHPSRCYPRGDLDNFAKGVLDAMVASKKVMVDDTQIVYLALGKTYAVGGIQPHVHITWEYR